jgi:hypothetical protein
MLVKLRSLGILALGIVSSGIALAAPGATPPATTSAVKPTEAPIAAEGVKAVRNSYFQELDFSLRVELEKETSPNATTGISPVIGASVGYGYCLYSGVEPFIEASYKTYSDTFTGGKQTTSTTDFGVGVLFNLYPHKGIEPGALRPYGGAAIVRSDIAVSSELSGQSPFTRRVTDTNTQFVFGTKYYLGRDIALNPQARFFTTNGDRSAGSANMSSRRLGIDLRLLGVTLIF